MSTETSDQKWTSHTRQFQNETVAYISLTDLHPFPNQPFKVRDDKAMRETVESVREYGVLTPAIVRPRESGGYEIVSGHRRKRACELTGVDTLPAIIREMDDDIAVILLVDSNIQREEILPSEKAQAYKLKMEAIRRRAGRPAKGKGLSQNDETIVARQPFRNIEEKEIRKAKKEYNKQNDQKVAQKKRIYKSEDPKIKRHLPLKGRDGNPNDPLGLYGGV